MADHLGRTPWKQRSQGIIPAPPRDLPASHALVVSPDLETAVSIPDPLFESAEALARRPGLSRSQLYAEALRNLVEQHEEAGARAVLDEPYTTEPSGLPEGAINAQESILSEWRDD